jgi:hypothetical protein
MARPRGRPPLPNIAFTIACWLQTADINRARFMYLTRDRFPMYTEWQFTDMTPRYSDLVDMERKRRLQSCLPETTSKLQQLLGTTTQAGARKTFQRLTGTPWRTYGTSHSLNSSSLHRASV